MSDFWDVFANAYINTEVPSTIDQVLQSRNRERPSVLALTDKGRVARGLPLPISAGTRVAFKYNTGAVLTYDNIPERGVEGAVIRVKTAEGNVTASSDGLVFVKWDDGGFRPVYAEHLKAAVKAKKMANNIVIRTADLDNLGNFFHMAGMATTGELVHKATKDLWSLRADGDSYVVERLFNYDGNPLKV